MEANAPDVSIIVPVYKAEKTLACCVKTIQAQTHTNIEIILVDDGSPDNCGTICDELAAGDERIRVIHQPNGGVSSARNAGVQAATASYICFVDSDDEVHPDYVLVMYQAMINQNADFVVCAYNKCTGETKTLFPVTERTLNMDQASWSDICDLLTSEYMFGPWNKMFRRDKIVNNGISFDRRIAYSEDAIFVYQYIVHCQICSFSSAPLYDYKLDNSTACRKYYPKMYWFYEIRFEAQKALIEQRFAGDEEERRRLIAHIAIEDMKGVMFHYIEYRVDKKEALRACEYTYSYFVGYFKTFLNEKAVFTDRTWEWIENNRKWLEKDDVPVLYRRWKKARNQKLKKKKSAARKKAIRRTLKKIRRAFFNKKS